MCIKKQWVAFNTLLRKEVVRYLRIWGQTLLPSPVTTTLYFVIFGNLVGSRIGQIEGVSYIEYIAPGLIIMAIITNSYSNVVSSFFGIKFQKSIEELYVAPISSLTIILGFCIAGVTRGLLVGALVTLAASFFMDFKILHLGTTLCVATITAMLFSLAGLLNAIFARKFDDVNIIPVFVLTPLTYLGGVFYSAKMLPPLGEQLSYLNPIFYIVNAFRYGFLGVTDVNIWGAIAAIGALVVTFFITAWILVHKGVGVRS